MQQISSRTRTNSNFFGEKRGRESEKRERKGEDGREWRLEKKRERERNVQQCQQFGRCKRVSIRDAALRFVYFSRKAFSTWRLSLASDTCAYSAALSPFLLLASPFVVGRSFTVVDRRRHAFACSSKKGVTPRCDNGTIIRANNNDVGNWDVNVRVGLWNRRAQVSGGNLPSQILLES